MSIRKRLIDAQLHLLDRQILDINGEPISKVDDLELHGVEIGSQISPDSPAPTITALVSGPVVLNRIFGGRPPDSHLYRIEWALVDKVGIAVDVSVKSESLPVSWAERWVRDHIIGRIPGARHDPE